VFIFVGNSRFAVWINAGAAVAFLVAALVKPESSAWYGSASAVCALLSLASFWMVRRSERPGPPPARTPNPRVCSRCLHVNQEGWRYCSQCGENP
jgi:hypothetical protein